MSLPDLDRYYTPKALARRMIETAELLSVDRCLDSTCGDGNLLLAAQRVLGDVRCIGIDVDGAAVARLRARFPTWLVSHGDALAASMWRRSHAARVSLGCDLAVLNPPFSMGHRKGIFLDAPGFRGRCSIAMAHVLSVLLRACPQTCCAIVPESLLHSDLDSLARMRLTQFYRMSEGLALRSSTFRGARANAVIIKFIRRPHMAAVAPENLSLINLHGVVLVRGGLPIFEARTDRRGMPCIHSTDLRAVAHGAELESLRHVRPIGRGHVTGNVMLLPRVGLPSKEYCRTLQLRRTVQLSDCVVGLEVVSQRADVM
jgi:hypothetical protein